MINEEGDAEDKERRLQKCVKCPAKGTLCGLDPKKATYCKDCFIQMVTHKFSSEIGKRRLYKDGSSRETLIVFEGDNSSAYLLSLIVQGIRNDARKRLTMIPTILVLVTHTEDERIAEVVRQVKCFSSDCDSIRWLFVHISSVVESSSTFEPFILPHPRLSLTIEKWNRLLNSCNSDTVREELLRLSRTILCIRVAKQLGITKVVFADSMDKLARDALVGFAFARGLATHQQTDVIDRPFPYCTFVRPLRDISEKEIAIVNALTGSDRYLVLIEGVWKGKKGSSKTFNSATSEFLANLHANGFSSTMNSVLGTVAKLHPLKRYNAHCLLCATRVCTLLERQQFCYACSSLIDDIEEKSLLEELYLRELPVHDADSTCSEPKDSES